MLSCQTLYQLSHLPSSDFYFFCLPAYGKLLVICLFSLWRGQETPCSPSVLPLHSCILRLGSEFCIVSTQHTYSHPCYFNFSSFCLVAEKKGRCSWCQGEPWKIPPRQGGGEEVRGVVKREGCLFNYFFLRNFAGK